MLLCLPCICNPLTISIDIDYYHLVLLARLGYCYCENLSDQFLDYVNRSTSFKLCAWLCSSEGLIFFNRAVMYSN